MSDKKVNRKIGEVTTTPDTITGRGGLALFSRYLENIGIFTFLDDEFGDIRKSSKGLPIWFLFKQILCFLFDGTSRHISYFDEIKKDEGYAGAIEANPDKMASSHVIKRFFAVFGWWCGKSFRWILKTLFIWRLRIDKPDVIHLFIDTMVMNNDDAKKRHGSKPTYKKVMGFQPLQIIWNGKIIDAIFRGGNKHGNAGNTVSLMVIELVKLIRKAYRQDVTIILRCDAGFFDQKNFAAFNQLNIGFVATGKMYDGIKTFVGNTDPEFWETYENGNQEWNYIEFGFGCSSWGFFLRAIYTTLVCIDKQYILDFDRPDNVILTNIGVNEKVLENCPDDQKEQILDVESIIFDHHQKGNDELAHRGFKDFASEKLPFKRFGPNTAYYYCMVICFFLFETFKQDVLKDVVPITSYAMTVRRRVVDIAAKIVKTGGKIVLKISVAVFEALQFDILWQRSNNPPLISL